MENEISNVAATASLHCDLCKVVSDLRVLRATSKQLNAPMVTDLLAAIVSLERVRAELEKTPAYLYIVRSSMEFGVMRSVIEGGR
jgi:hypothetical protein